MNKNYNQIVSFLVILIFLFSSIVLSGCLLFQPKGRLSGTVLFVHSDEHVRNWLNNPSKSYVQAYFMFPSDFASDIIFGIDQEMIEGVNDPIHFPGADWMALVGLNRDGLLQIPIGTDESLNGTPSDASVWEMIDLEVSLKPNTWYLMREIADFHARKFESFTLLGPDINITVDLSDYYVDYPNYIPIDNRSMTYYVFAIRVSTYAQPGSTVIYFDDVEAGLLGQQGYETVLMDGFEKQQIIPDLPISLPVSPLSDITELYWYKENEQALVEIEDDISLNGQYACACNATVEGLIHKKPMLSFFPNKMPVN